ncbi:MAG: metallophosphoesterase [Planctomycetota bacterium]
MKLLATSDTHYGEHEEADRATRRLAEQVAASDADAFALVGDVAGAGTGDFRDCLQAFRGFEGTKLVVPGNHDMWTDGPDSYRKYTRILPEVADDCGFHMLDQGPVTVGDTAIIGNMGWYDYSFRDPSLELTTADYRSKTMEGVGTWMDKLHVNWNLTDEEFTAMCLQRLRRHYRQVQGRAERVVVILHHVPFEELLYEDTDNLKWKYCRAYLGARRFGEAIRQWDDVAAVICGHRHRQASFREDGMHAFVVGSRSEVKRLLALDPATGRHEYTDFPVEGADEPASEDDAS